MQSGSRLLGCSALSFLICTLALGTGCAVGFDPPEADHYSGGRETGPRPDRGPDTSWPDAPDGSEADTEVESSVEDAPTIPGKYGSRCIPGSSVTCVPGLSCISLQSETVTKGFCTKPCTTFTDPVCSVGSPTGTLPACICGYAGSIYCGFFCRYNGSTFICPPNMTCSPTSDPEVDLCIP